MSYRETLEKLLSETLNETHFDYNEAFSLSKYEIGELKYSAAMAQYNLKDDKITIKQDVFRSLNKKLTLKVFEGIDDEQEIYKGTTIRFNDIVNFSFIKNRIKHEEAHRQFYFLNLDHYGPYSKVFSHNEVFFYVLNLLGGKMPEIYLHSKNGNDCEDTYENFRRGLDKGYDEVSNVFFINRNCKSYDLNKDLAEKIENYAKCEKDGNLMIFDKDNGLKLVTCRGVYSLNFDLDFNKNKGAVYSNRMR